VAVNSTRLLLAIDYELPRRGFDVVGRPIESSSTCPSLMAGYGEIAKFAGSVGQPDRFKSASISQFDPAVNGFGEIYCKTTLVLSFLYDNSAHWKP